MTDVIADIIPVGVVACEKRFCCGSARESGVSSVHGIHRPHGLRIASLYSLIAGNTIHLTCSTMYCVSSTFINTLAHCTHRSSLFTHWHVGKLCGGPYVNEQWVCTGEKGGRMPTHPFFFLWFKTLDLLYLLIGKSNFWSVCVFEFLTNGSFK
jgi:hypothetical protein